MYRFPPRADRFPRSSGGVVSTVHDLLRWLAFQLGGGHGVLIPTDLALMHRPPAGITTDYAVGWTYRPGSGRAVLEHTGVVSTYYVYQAIVPASG